MSTTIRAFVVATGLLAGVGTVSVFSQAADHSHVGKMSGTTMSHDEMIAKMGKMSTDDKAVLIDEMPAKDRMAAMKTSGHDSKMSAQQKAAMFDTMPMDKKMSMMMMHQSMMDKNAERARRG